MSSNSSLSIERLPVEIFHRIFDHLDAPTILFSIQPVCRLFRSVVNSYDRYYLNFKIISKWNFHRLCRFIPPQHLISLTLYHNERIPDQITFFISNYRFRQLTRLHSLNLFGIDEAQLASILEPINLTSLTSFSLHIETYDERLREITKHYLSLVMAQSTLRKVKLKIRENRISTIKWPSNCRIECLIINENMIINNLIPILSCSPQLHRLILKNISSSIIDVIIPKSSFIQLTSLTLEESDMSVDELESFLLLTPSLSHLKLVGQGCFDNGKRWEEFIQANLPHLNKFEFFISYYRSTDQTPEDLQLIIKSFQSPFWIENKKCFVACECYSNGQGRTKIYSIPICKSIFQYEAASTQLFLSTSSDLSITKDINEIILPSEMLMNDETLKRMNTSFANVTKLSIDVPRKLSINLWEYLSSVINISQLVQIKLESYYLGHDNRHVLRDMVMVILELRKLSSLIIHSQICEHTLYSFLSVICLLLPREIKYLEIPIIELEQVEAIFQRCPDLSVIKFQITRTELFAEVVQWLQENTIDSMFTRHDIWNSIWIGEKIDQINENPKRIKLTENESES